MAVTRDSSFDFTQWDVFVNTLNKRNLTQTRVARALGVSRQAVTNWYNGCNNMSRQHVNRFNFAYRAKVPYASVNR